MTAEEIMKKAEEIVRLKKLKGSVDALTISCKALLEKPDDKFVNDLPMGILMMMLGRDYARMVIRLNELCNELGVEGESDPLDRGGLKID